ncbi:hypothetical protein C7Y71_003135 [Pseudoprevotella muciniphila]|uniref:Uncharacterized protein n=1 Tax=Pseudoprevotella muciniphila TaxID=2133944 RepID=A0A5P8E9R9_9BACT|nr:hypothetical protein C7Y71_003135 [Pseudoprevotella muciniphila]
MVRLAKDLYHLNWEAKIGILFLIPPIYGVICFIFNEMNVDPSLFWYGDIDTVVVYEYYSAVYKSSNMPLYLGLMAIAGAYLIKGNLKRKINQ